MPPRSTTKRKKQSDTGTLCAYAKLVGSNDFCFYVTKPTVTLGRGDPDLVGEMLAAMRHHETDPATRKKRKRKFADTESSEEEVPFVEGPMADVPIGLGSSLSKEHARIFYDSKTAEWSLVCLGKNPIFVNGVAVARDDPPVPLPSQTLIQFSKDRLFYFLLPTPTLKSRAKTVATSATVETNSFYRDRLPSHGVSVNIERLLKATQGNFTSTGAVPWSRDEREILRKALLSRGFGNWQKLALDIQSECSRSRRDIKAMAVHFLSGIHYQLIADDVEQVVPIKSILKDHDVSVLGKDELVPSISKWPMLAKQAQRWANKLVLLHQFFTIVERMGVYSIVKANFTTGSNLAIWWNQDCDRDLLRGVLVHGHSALGWKRICEDPNFCFRTRVQDYLKQEERREEILKENMERQATKELLDKQAKELEEDKKEQNKKASRRRGKGKEKKNDGSDDDNDGEDDEEESPNKSSAAKMDTSSSSVSISATPSSSRADAPQTTMDIDEENAPATPSSSSSLLSSSLLSLSPSRPMRSAALATLLARQEKKKESTTTVEKPKPSMDWPKNQVLAMRFKKLVEDVTKIELECKKKAEAHSAAVAALPALSAGEVLGILEKVEAIKTENGEPLRPEERVKFLERLAIICAPENRDNVEETLKEPHRSAWQELLPGVKVEDIVLLYQFVWMLVEIKLAHKTISGVLLKKMLNFVRFDKNFAKKLWERLETCDICMRCIEVEGWEKEVPKIDSDLSSLPVGWKTPDDDVHLLEGVALHGYLNWLDFEYYQKRFGTQRSSIRQPSPTMIHKRVSVILKSFTVLPSAPPPAPDASATDASAPDASATDASAPDASATAASSSSASDAKSTTPTTESTEPARENETSVSSSFSSTATATEEVNK